jgi:HD-GYP domain-containing protein (c-di-GMP phosphodiesterase class II)
MTILHRLRSIASIGGREQDLAAILRGTPRLVRPLLELSDPYRVAEACAALTDELGVESMGHARRLEAHMVMLGEALGLETRSLACGALLHDVGKIAVPRHILDSADTLAPTDLDLIRMHSDLGHAILFGIESLREAALLVRHHHEYWDGSGYPDGIARDRIPLGARIFAIADSFDAMVRVDRPFRAGVEGREAWGEIESLAGEKYDPRIVALVRDEIGLERFLEVGALYPGEPRSFIIDAA